MRPIIIFLFVLAIWGAVALDVKVTSSNAETIAEDEVRDKNSPKERRELQSVGMAQHDTAMKSLEEENTQITEVNRQQELTIGQLQLQVSQLSTNTMKLQEESEKLRAQLSTNTMKLQEESEKLRAQLSTNTMKLQEEIEKFRAQLKSTPSHFAGAIGFYAKLGNSISTPETQTLVLSGVVYNSGGGYDPTTGVFTAPVTGLYLFLANIIACDSGKDALIQIVLDNTELCKAFSRYSTEIELASCHAATRMVKGQKVKILADGRVNGKICAFGWTTFTGVLIQAEE